MSNENNIAPINGNLNVVNNEVEIIKQKIYFIRGKQVMLDSDVAEKYQYTTKNINKAMKRNIERFPEDFCFQLTEEEIKNLRFQIGTSSLEKENYGGRRYLPYVYTEQGIAMLSGMLKNEIAVEYWNQVIKCIECEEYAIDLLKDYYKNNKKTYSTIIKNIIVFCVEICITRRYKAGVSQYGTNIYNNVSCSQNTRKYLLDKYDKYVTILRKIEPKYVPPTISRKPKTKRWF